jgi:tetratricopeptide (TPR) repeat protein/tRNA A-37 threonylcarbamoyl transferase component Bud32
MTSPAVPGAFPPVAPQVRTGRYAMKKFHAKGGMGEVWLAEDCVINRPVALKKIRAGCEAELKERFLLEAQITGQLEHPGVVPVHELGSDDAGQPFYAMRFIQGRTLEAVIEEHHAPGPKKDPQEVGLLRLLRVFLNLCQTVAYAHSRDVIHRDLKPDNVMVGDYGETLLLDWGLAKTMGHPDTDPADILHRSVHLPPMSESTQTLVGSVKGTPGYMAPEAAEGLNDEVDQTSDIYLLGAILYHILTGRPPRRGNSLIKIIMEARKTPPPPPRTIKPDIPKPLDAICQKAMAFKKEDRYPAAQALAADIERYLAGEPVSAYRETLAERTWRWMKRHRQALSWAAAILAVVVTAGIGVAKWQQLQRQAAADRAEAEEQLREEGERREAAQKKAEELKKQEEARNRLREFRRLADEMRFYAAIPDPAGEQPPPLVDLESGEAKGRAALALLTEWGPDLAGLPLDGERAGLKAELYELLLLMAQTRGRRGADRATGRDMLALLERAAPLRSPTASYHRLSAQAYRLLGDEKKAGREQRLAADPKTPSTALDHFLVGMSLQMEATRPADADAQGDAARAERDKLARQAIERYRQALRLEPNHYWAHLQLGSSYMGLLQRAEAAEALNACVALRPDAPWGYSIRGVALVGQKRFEDAIADLNRAIELSPNFRLPRLTRGIAYWTQKKYDEALADFEAVLAPPAHQQLIEGGYYRGQIHLERDQFKEALAAFDRVVAARRGFRSLQIYRARCLLMLGRQQEALAALDAFLAGGKAFDPQTGEAHGRRGRLLRFVIVPKLPPRARGKVLILALAQLEKAVELGARSVPVYEDLGAVLEQLGQTDRAVAAYSEALKLAPDEVKVRVKRGWALADLRPPQYDRAREDFELVVRKDPAHAEANAGLGYIQACRKAPAEARRAANRALLHGAGDYLVLHNVACVYARLAQNDAAKATEYEDLAIDYLRRAVELWRRGGTGPDEPRLIEAEPSFHPGLRARPEFKKLLRPQEF